MGNRPRIKPFTNGEQRVRVFVVHSRMVFGYGEGQCTAFCVLFGGEHTMDGHSATCFYLVIQS